MKTNLIAAGIILAAINITRHAFAQTWTPTSAPALTWRTVACSADGIKLVAAGYAISYPDMEPDVYTPEPVYISVDAGTTWTQTSAPSNLWTSIASSADGVKIVAVAVGAIYTSPDSGATWIQTSASTNNVWSSVACSADGTKLTAAVGAADYGYGNVGPIYTSTNSGLTWMQTTAPTNGWISVASSADGTKLVAAAVDDGYGDGGAIYISNDSGSTWTGTSAPGEPWSSVASSADGNRLVAAVGGGTIYTSFDSGLSWTKATMPDEWVGGKSVASSADGTRMFAAPELVYYGGGNFHFNGSIYESTNSGVTWNAMPILEAESYANEVRGWFGVACSADGIKLAAAHNGDFLIYTAAPDSSEPWKVTSLPGIEWSGFTENFTGSFRSTDGSKLVAVGQTFSTNQTANGVVLISSDSGSTWTRASVPGQCVWSSVAGSEDATKLVVVAIDTVSGLAYSANGPIYTSSDSGATWIQASAPTNNSWSAVSSSADGTKLAAATWNGTIYVSVNSGLTWMQTTAPTNQWAALASSRDGTNLAAAAQSDIYGNGGLIYISKDSGTTWTQTTGPSNFWVSIASSADGTKLVAASYDWQDACGLIYTSSDSGATWIQTSAPTNFAWSSVTSSSDGNKLAASAIADAAYTMPGLIYYSSDSGATWAVAPLPSEYWNSVACSADGTKLVGLAEGGDPEEAGLGIGYIYNLSNLLFRVLPSPRLTISPSSGSFGISWLIPSTSFVLQKNSDLTAPNWTDVPITPALNFTNLNYQLTVSATNSQCFYRLRSP
jgi:hypothetical protein